MLLEDGRVVALDAKVTIDDNALVPPRGHRGDEGRVPDRPVQARANEKGLQYVKLDGEVGIIGNGAGLVMSTLDVVAQAGARAANFLDVGGGASADQMATSLEVVLSRPGREGRAHQHLRRDHALRPGRRGRARGAGAGRAPTVPIVVRLDGTNAEEGRRILAEAAHPRIVPAATMLEAAERAADFANGAAA